jgi:hypothetical protein
MIARWSLQRELELLESGPTYINFGDFLDYFAVPVAYLQFL